MNNVPFERDLLPCGSEHVWMCVNARTHMRARTHRERKGYT